MTPLVEVLMATYDGERYLARAARQRARPDAPAAAAAGARRRLHATAPLALLRALDGDRAAGRRGCAERRACPQRVLPPARPAPATTPTCGPSPTRTTSGCRTSSRVPWRRSTGVEGPALYCARVLVVDEQLQPLYPHELPHRGPSFANALVQNIALGCTVVLNRRGPRRAAGRRLAPRVRHARRVDVPRRGRAPGPSSTTTPSSCTTASTAATRVGMGRGPVSRLRRAGCGGSCRRTGRASTAARTRELLRMHGERPTPPARAQLEAFLAAQAAGRGGCATRCAGAAHRQTRGSDLVLKGLQVLGRV